MAMEQYPHPQQDDDDDLSNYFRPSPRECILILLHKFMGNKPLPQCSSIFDDDRNPYDPDQLSAIFLSAERRRHGVYLFTKLSKKGKLTTSNKNASRVVGNNVGSWHCELTVDIPYNGTTIGTVRTLTYREKEKGSDPNHHRFQMREYTLPEKTRLGYNPLKHHVLCHISLNDQWCNGQKVTKKAKKYSNSNKHNGNNSPTSCTTNDRDQVPTPKTLALPAAIGYDQVATLSTSAPATDYDQVPTPVWTSAPAEIDYDQVPTPVWTSAPTFIGYDQVSVLSTSAPAAIDYAPVWTPAPAAIDYDQLPTQAWTSSPTLIGYYQVPTPSTSAPAAIDYDQVPMLSTLAPAPAAIGCDQVPMTRLCPEPIATFQDGQEAFTSNMIKLDDSLAFSSRDMMVEDDSLAFLDDIIFDDDDDGDFGRSQVMQQEVDSYIQDIPDDDFFSVQDPFKKLNRMHLN